MPALVQRNLCSLPRAITSSHERSRLVIRYHKLTQPLYDYSRNLGHDTADDLTEKNVRVSSTARITTLLTLASLSCWSSSLMTSESLIIIYFCEVYLIIYALVFRLKFVCSDLGTFKKILSYMGYVLDISTQVIWIRPSS